MEAQRMTITEFLTARYDEEERRAGIYHTLAEEFGSVVGLPTPHQTELPIALAAQVAIARTSARILADIAAKRRIVAMHGQAVAIDTVLDHLASAYDQHPDFDPAWRVA